MNVCVVRAKPPTNAKNSIWVTTKINANIVVIIERYEDFVGEVIHSDRVVVKFILLSVNNIYIMIFI